MSRSDISTKFENISDRYIEYVAPKEKISKQWFTDHPQRYSGEVLHDNIHGNGFYFIEKEDKFFYDGLFYSNELEGYSQIFYGDGSHFQGLFKEHKRFGPGVFTYPNSDQDVGLWSGFSMVRLESVMGPNVIPRIGNTAAGKLKLLKYRYLVPVCPNDKDVATEILQDLKANENVLKDSYKLYNLEVENKNNLFFNTKLYDGKFYRAQDCVIDIIVSEEEEETVNVGKAAEEEEESFKSSITDLGRVRQISDELELIERRLKAIKKSKKNLSKKVDYCRWCCYYEAEETFSQKRPSTSDQKQGENMETMMSTPGSLSPDTVSYATIDYEKDIHSFNPDKGIDRLTESVMNDALSKIESYLYGYCFCDEEMQIHDLGDLERQLEQVIKDETFYETIRKDLQKKLETHLKKTEVSNAKLKTRQVVVNDLLAWNNEELSIGMLKHSFLHRKSEYMVTFNVSSLLKGKRSEFSSPGLHERSCCEFLSECGKGAIRRVLELVKENNINVNVSDARGNTGVFFAAANGRDEIIPVLVNFGAKLDQLNDEGLTPLSLCLLIYLAINNHRGDWDSSFLSESNLPFEFQGDISRWFPDKSLLSLSTQSVKKGSGEVLDNTYPTENRLLVMSDKKQENVKENYLFDTSFKVFKEPKKKKGKDKTVTTPIEYTPSEIEIQEENKHLTEVTVNTLLECGANPNIGEVPLAPLLLSVFTENENLVRRILLSQADADVTMNEQLSSLLIIASLRCVQENVNICKTLLEFGCDTNLKTSTSHWSEQKVAVLGKKVKPDEYEDFGKNALHILCLRQDFPTDDCHYFENLAVMLIEHKINVNEMYLGHTPLSLAVLSGNINLVEVLMKRKPLPTDPHFQLGYNMGNVLTLYILKRYENILPLDKCQEMLKLLVTLGVNPLRSIGDFENAIEFIEKEHEVVKEDKSKNKKGGKDKSSKGTNKSKKDSKKSSKKGKKGKITAQEVLKDYLKELARDTIIKYVQLEAVEHLYNLAEASMLEYNFAKVLAEFLTPPVAFENLVTIFNHGRIKPARFDKNICLQVIEFVEKYQKVIKVKKGKNKKEKKGKKEKKSKDDKKSKKSKGSGKSSKTEEVPEEKPNYSDIIDATSFAKVKKDKAKVKVIKPGLDNTTKYNVCFHCLKKVNKVLLLCPKCQYVYFCSEQCNKVNVKMKAQHTCNVNFYKTEKQRLDLGDLVYPENLHELCKMAKESCEENLRRRQEDELELQRIQLEEERKLDIYGTRFLKKKQGDQNQRKSETATSTQVTSFVPSLCTTEKMFMTYPSLDHRLTRLSLSEAKYVSMMSKKHESSLRGSEGKIKGRTKRKEQAKKKSAKSKYSCKCRIEDSLESEMTKAKHKSSATVNVDKKTIYKEHLASKFETTSEVLSEPEMVVRKLRKIPSKYQYFIELLSHFFPDVDLSFLFLPYACYSNGHLYYKFLDENVFSKTYSMM